ncbi:hypothetical protein ACFFU9_10390 [Mariniflexile ostreae]|uniref:Uncharacterized protein n=1 Tax=Mariniflexile ostreae TaxID=1520892 RepID=A0ABV5FCN4_9FLAO
MKANPFNICPSCKHNTTCVLTNQKQTVWNCSEYQRIQGSVKNMTPEPEYKWAI